MMTLTGTTVCCSQANKGLQNYGKLSHTIHFQKNWSFSGLDHKGVNQGYIKVISFGFGI